MNENKVYVRVNVSFTPEGEMIPQSITWTDGRVYKIDGLLGVRLKQTMKNPTDGDRYTVQVHDQRCYLFFERSSELMGTNVGRWYTERKTA